MAATLQPAMQADAKDDQHQRGSSSEMTPKSGTCIASALNAPEPCKRTKTHATRPERTWLQKATRALQKALATTLCQAHANQQWDRYR